jgi:hypothetical protein
MRMILTFWMLALAVASLSGRVGASARSDAQGIRPDEASGSMRPSQLNKSPRKYDGREVVVTGFVTLVSEGHTLYESQALDEEFRRRWDSGKSDFDPRDYVQYCLTIANWELMYKHKRALAGKTLTLKGIFVANYLDQHKLDTGACPLPTGFLVNEDDLERRYLSGK